MLFGSQPTSRATLRAFLLQPSLREEESRLFIDNMSGHLVDVKAIFTGTK
jgi:hypothetical protein